MNCLARNALFAGLAFGASIGMLGARAFSPNLPAASDQPDSLQADRALSTALERNDKTAAGAMLDAAFTWTDAQGKKRTKDETLQNLAEFAADNRDESGVRTHLYGPMATVLGIHHQARFVRVWVKRPAGWREFLELNTAIGTQISGSATRTLTGAPPSKGDCDNPCRTVPYKPTDEKAKAILATWQHTKTEEWHPTSNYLTYNMEHTADEFIGISSALIHNKAEVLETTKKQMQTGDGAPGDPVASMEIHVFGGTTGVMIAQNDPYRGGKPSYSVRVWVFRDNRWQLALTQVTRMQSADPALPISPKG